MFLRLLLGDVSFCFVNVHLSSGKLLVIGTGNIFPFFYCVVSNVCSLGAEKARQRRDQLQTILDSVFQVSLIAYVQPDV